MVKITIDKDKCIGCGACASICPDTFEIELDVKAKIKKSPKKVTYEQEAADMCPVKAINIDKSI